MPAPDTGIKISTLNLPYLRGVETFLETQSIFIWSYTKYVRFSSGRKGLFSMLMINEGRQLIYERNVLCVVEIEVIFSNDLIINTFWTFENCLGKYHLCNRPQVEILIILMYISSSIHFHWSS